MIPMEPKFFFFVDNPRRHFCSQTGRGWKIKSRLASVGNRTHIIWYHYTSCKVATRWSTESKVGQSTIRQHQQHDFHNHADNDDDDNNAILELKSLLLCYPCFTIVALQLSRWFCSIMAFGWLLLWWHCHHLKISQKIRNYSYRCCPSPRLG
jgi:hypothetical protein